MTDPRNGPPDKRKGPAPTDRPSPDTSSNASSVEQADRRRAAARRLPVLACRCRDPWVHHCQEEPGPSELVADAYRDAVLHLRDCGLLAAPRLLEMRALWRRGGDDRQLISEITQRWEAA